MRSIFSKRILAQAVVLATSALFVTACSAPLPPPVEPPVAPPEPPKAPDPIPEPPKPVEVIPDPPKEEPLKLPGPISFATSSDKLTAESDVALEHIRKYLEKQVKVTRFRIEGHTDSVGAKASNLKLSGDRALSVATWLVSHGIDCKRIIAVGFGDSKPVGDNKTPEGRAENRRTVFINAEVEGKALGGKPIDGGGTVAADVCSKR